MKKIRSFIGVTGPILVLLTLLTDANSALKGARAGIELCINSVIPSLFPFLVFGSLLSNNLIGTPVKVLSWLGKLCKIPTGYESVLIPAYLGGYPVGAQNINEAYRSGVIKQSDAKRLMAFCNNAGPSFIFGIGSILFENHAILWLLWLIHIVSSIVVGMLIPVNEQSSTMIIKRRDFTVSQALKTGINTMATICGWVVLFRILITILNSKFLSTTPYEMRIPITGVLELTNGCCDLIQLSSIPMRFLLFSCFVALGGICVGLQTATVAKDVGVDCYFPGKIIQTGITYFLSLLAVRFVFGDNEQINVPFYISAFFVTISFISLYFIKNSSNRLKNVV